MSKKAEDAAREWARGAVRSAQDSELREVKQQLESIVELLADLMIRIGTVEAQLENKESSG